MLLESTFENTGCPIKNEPTLEEYHFVDVRYFFEQFEGGESTTF